MIPFWQPHSISEEKDDKRLLSEAAVASAGVEAAMLLLPSTSTGVPIAKDPGYLGAHLTNLPAGILWPDVCTQKEVASQPWCNTALPDAQRAAAFVKALRADEKIKLLDNEAEGVERLYIPPHQWASEGLHGAAQSRVCSPADPSRCATPTSFPAPSGLGAAFNRSLFWAVGHTTGREARAISNLRTDHDNFYGDGLSYWSPTINLALDPRWGRNMEVPGEDPTLTGQYAASFVRGLQGASQQGDGEPPRGRHTVLGCCKHFIANNLESWGGFTRHNVDARVPLRDLADYHLLPFEACVKEGRSKAVMCSYNKLNGVPMCAHSKLLNHTLRTDWQFDGYVTADCDAVGDIYTPKPDGHGLTADPAHGAAEALKAGTDVDCGYWGKRAYYNELPKALARGLISESHLDTSLLRLTRLQMQLGLFDPKHSQPLFRLGIETVHSKTHRQLALEAARQAIVLLKNDGLTLSPTDGEVLPLSPGTKLAVIGPHHDAREVLLSNYHGQACTSWGGDLSCIPSPLEAIVRRNGKENTVASRGCTVGNASAAGEWGDATTGAGASMNAQSDGDGNGNGDGGGGGGGRRRRPDLEIPLPIDAAVEAAKSADRVVLLVGLDMKSEGEGQDRIHTRLPGQQEELVRRVLATGTPTVLVLMHGGAISLGEDVISGAGAILDVGYGGEAGSEALADVLFGDYNPSGRLPITMYNSSYVEKLPLTEMSLTKGVGRTYMYYSGTPEFPFGAGLSYDAWELNVQPEQLLALRETTTDSAGGAEDGGGAFGGGSSSNYSNILSDAVTGSMKERGKRAAFLDWIAEGGPEQDDALRQIASAPRQMRTARGASITFNVAVSNKGAHGGNPSPGRGGSATVLAFWEPTHGQHAPLRRRLFGFEGVEVAAGGTEMVTIELPSDALAVANELGQRIVWPGEYRIVFEGPDPTSNGASLSVRVHVKGEPRVVGSVPAA